MNPIVENLDNTDTRELPTERGPRGVAVSDVAQAPPLEAPVPTSPPRVSTDLANQRLADAEASAQRTMQSRPEVGEIPDAQLTPISVGNPVLDPNTYSNAFTRELQDQVDAMSNQGGGNVPVYAGSTYFLPDTTPPANTLMGEFNVSDFAPPAPAPAGGSGRKSGGFLSNAYEHYTDPAYAERAQLQQDGLSIDPTTNALQQAGSGIGGLFSLARRGITALVRGAGASGQALVGKPSKDASRAEKVVRGAGAVLTGGGGLALLNPTSRRAFIDTVKNEFSGVGPREREALRQLSPTSGAGQAGKKGPLRGDFGEYGTNLLGGVQYVFDGFGNQARANIAARIEVSDNPLELATNLIFAPSWNKELGAATRRNMQAAWNGKDFSFLNPDGPLGLVGDKFFNPNGTRAEKLASRVSLPFRIAAGVALDTITGPDPTDIIGHLRRPAGKGAKAVKSVAGAAPSSAIVLQRPVVDVYPRPVTPRTPRPSLPSAPVQRALPGTPPRPALPPARGVNMSALFTPNPTPPLLEDVRVLTTLPNVGTPDLTPNLPRPRRVLDDELGTALASVTADLPTLDLRTGRITPVVEPDLKNVAPSGIRDPWDDAPNTLDEVILDEFPEVPIVGDPWSDARAPRRDPWEDPDLKVVPEPGPRTFGELELDDIPEDVADALDTIPKEYEDMSLEELFAEVDRIGGKYDDVPADQVASLDAARQARDIIRESGWADLADAGTEKISVLRTRGPIGVVRDTPGTVIQGNFPQRPPADVVDIFTKQVRSATQDALEDVDLSRKVLEHSTAAGTTLVTNQGALVRADEFLGAGARQIEDLANKAAIARSAGDEVVAAQHEAVIKAIRGSTKDNPVSPPTRTDVLTSAEVDELVPAVTIEQLTPVRRADQAVRELGSTNLLDQAFDLKAVERSKLVNRRREDLQALAHWMGHWPEDVSLTWDALRKLNDKHGLYSVYGPSVNGFELDRARKNGVRRVQQVESNALLNVPSQSTVITSTPKVLKNQAHKAAVAEQNLIGQENVLTLLKGQPLADDVVADLVKTWVNSPGKSSTRRNLNTVLGGGGYQYTPDQVAALKNTYGGLPKKDQAKLPKGLRDVLKEVLPPTPARVNPDTPTPLAELLEPGVSAKELRATAVPSELRTASDTTLAAFVETRTRALDTRQAIVEVGSDLAMVEAEQARIYQELASLPELEPRSIMDGTWDTGRVNERVETVLEVLDTPVNRRANDPPFTGAVVEYASVPKDDLFYGSPFLGGVENPRALPLGSSNPLRGAYPPGFAVVTNDPKLARALAQGRVPDNTVLGQLTVQPAIDKVYLSPTSVILDGDSPLPPAEYQRLLSKLSEFIDPLDRDVLRDILKKVPDLKDAPLGRIMERLQEGWAKLHPNKAPNDLLFAALGSGYREYVGRNGDALLMNLPGGRQVLLTPSPERALAEQFQRTGVDVTTMVPSDAALYRAYADEVLAEGGSTLSQVLGKNNRNQHAIELAQELTDEMGRLDNELDDLLDTESALRFESRALTEKEALEQAAQAELAQSKRIEDEFDDLLANSDPNPGCL